MEKLFDKQYINKQKEIYKNNYKASINLARFENALNLVTNSEEFQSILKFDIIDKISIIFDKKVTVSCAILVLNEERCIQRCINSLDNFFDEIIIVDTGSTDKTIEKIKELKNNKIKLYFYTWQNDFSKARNFAIRKSTCQWIIFIDADEEMQVIKGLKDLLLIMNYCNERNNLVMSFTIKEIDNNAIYNDIPRIFYCDGNCRYFGTVHEEIRCNEIYDPYLIKTNVVLYHDGYNKNILIKKEKIQRNLSLLKIMRKIEPNNLRWIYFYLRDGITVLPHDEMLQIINTTLLNNSNNNYSINNKYVVEIMLIYCELLLKENKLNKIINITNDLLQVAPNYYDVTYYNNLAKILSAQQYLNDALCCMIDFRKKNLNLQKSLINGNGYHIDLLIGLLLFENMQYDHSKKYLQFAKEKLSNQIDFNLIDKYLKILNKITTE